MRTTTPTDDKQLWRIFDSVDGRECSWPLYVTPSVESGNAACVLVELALPVETEAQWKFVNERLAPLAFDSNGPHWLIRSSAFEKNAVKCRGITPAYYMKWGDESGNHLEKSGSDKKEKAPTIPYNMDDDFVRYCCAEAGITEVPSARLLFHIFCQGALKWMLEKHKPVKLGFCTLYALPYRKNVMGILHARYPEILTVFRGKKELRDGILEAIGFTPMLHDTTLAGMQTTTTFGWSIHCVEERPFETTAEKMEAEILAGADKPVKYVMRWSGLVKKFYENTMEVFSTWLEKASVANGAVDQTLPKSDWCLRGQVRRGSVRPSRAKVPATQFNCSPRTADDHTATANETDEAQAEGV